MSPFYHCICLYQHWSYHYVYITHAQDLTIRETKNAMAKMVLLYSEFCAFRLYQVASDFPNTRLTEGLV